MKMVVLVLDANQRSALAVTRSLGRNKQIDVFTADSTDQSLAGRSCYSRGYIKLPSPETHPENFIASLVSTVKKFDIQYIQPVTEISCQTIALHQHELLPAIVPVCNLQTIKSISNKANLIEIARELGVPVPHTKVYKQLADWKNATESAFPLVIKPAESRIFAGNSWISTNVRIASSKEQLQRYLNKDSYLENHPFMVQQFIPGSGAGVFVLYDKGKLIASFAHRRLREKPPSGGVSVLSQSTDVDPTLLHYANAILEKVEWSGVAMVEYRITPTGEPYLMEINTRFWGSLQLAVDSGVDFPYLTFKLFTGQPVSGNTYKTNQRLRWFLGDVDNLYLYLKSSGIPIRKKFTHLLAFFKPIKNCKNEVLRFPDYKPAIFELKQYIKNILK